MFLQPLHHELLADQSITKHKVRFLLGHSLCYQLWKFGRTEMYLVLLYVAYNKLWGRYSLIEYITIILCFWTAIVAAILWLPIVTNWVVPKNPVYWVLNFCRRNGAKLRKIMTILVEIFYIYYYQKSDFVKRVIRSIIKLFKSKYQLGTLIFSNERVNWNLEM